MTAKLLFNISAVIEVWVGIVLLIAPAHVIGLLLGDPPDPIGKATARILGIGLLSLGISAWETTRRPASAHITPVLPFADDSLNTG